MGNNVSRKIFLLSFSIVIVMIGYGVIIPLFPFLIDNFGAEGKHLGLILAVAAFAQFIFAPFWGSLSDRVGRKPVLMIGMLGNAISLLSFAIYPKLWMLFLSRVISGILSSAMIPTSSAYISDITSDEERGDGIAKISGAMGLGVIIGPGIGGWIGQIFLVMPFYIASFFSMVSFLLIYIFLPETIDRKEERNLENGYFLNQMNQMKAAMLSPLWALLLLSMLNGFGSSSFQGIFGMYSLMKFNYNPTQIGLILMTVGIVASIVQFAITGKLIKKLGEKRLMRIALFGSSFGFFIMTMATSMYTVLLTTSVFVFAKTMLRPSIASLLSKENDNFGQGVVMGLNNSFMSIGNIIGPIWAGYFFDINIEIPYISGAVIMALGFFLISRFNRAL
ncbi:MAG: MFS transporter [Sedimentibacter sp.]